MVFGFHENVTYMFLFSGCIQRNYQNALLEEIVYHFLIEAQMAIKAQLGPRNPINIP